ncbi:MAG TPA: glycosyltransferase family 4 protein [Candidatus Binataceae bacterium]|jgi:glycosyltransferase involved in cell wall biosynthesis|nr:glycosyltransferase family 4 protein [Candidatus Binataceae bacterium]
MKSGVRLAYLVTHPIQYQAPLLRRIAAEPDIRLKVFFASDVSLREFVDRGFSRAIRWDVPLLSGYEYEFLPALGSKNNPSFWRPINYGLAARLEAGRFDALWVHGYMRWQHWAAMAAAKRRGIKVLVRDEATAISSLRGAPKRKLKKLLFAWLKRVADGFLAIGTLNGRYYQQSGIPDRRISMMPYAVDNAFFHARAAESASARAALRAALDLEPRRPVILYAGKMTARKAPGDLLDAYARLASSCPAGRRPYLLYVGDGELRRALEQRASARGLDTIRFLGFKNQTEMPALYELSDVCVVPSLVEPWGLVVNEAMNAGKAIVASDRVGCAPDLVHDGVNGFIFKAGDRADLTRRLEEALADPHRCAAMGQRSLEIIGRWSFEEDVQGLRTALGL